jgi:DNA-binding CsgD family transcriptional regulator
MDLCEGGFVTSGLREMALAVDLLANIAELSDPGHFPTVVLPALAGIVPCDVVTYNEMDVSTATVEWPAHSLDSLAGFPHRMGITLAPVADIALNRSRRDFTDHERDVVDLLRSPLAAAFTRLRRRSEAATALRSEAANALRRGDESALTQREQQVLELVAAGRTDAAIGHVLGCSPRTVSKHLEHAYRKLGVSSRAAAVAETARRIG